VQLVFIQRKISLTLIWRYHPHNIIQGVGRLQDLTGPKLPLPHRPIPLHVRPSRGVHPYSRARAFPDPWLDLAGRGQAVPPSGGQHPVACVTGSRLQPASLLLELFELGCACPGWPLVVRSRSCIPVDFVVGVSSGAGAPCTWVGLQLWPKLRLFYVLMVVQGRWCLGENLVWRWPLLVMTTPCWWPFPS
jgi:hypothetical protein